MTGLAGSGAVLGCALGLGLALIWLGPPRHRRPGLARRVLPYLRDTPRPSRLLDDGRPAGGALGAVAGPVVQAQLGDRGDVDDVVHPPVPGPGQAVPVVLTSSSR